MDVSVPTRLRTSSWRDQVAADYETQQARLSWVLDEDECQEEFL